jgi:hypothetical protein
MANVTDINFTNSGQLTRTCLNRQFEGNVSLPLRIIGRRELRTDITSHQGLDAEIGGDVLDYYEGRHPTGFQWQNRNGWHCSRRESWVSASVLYRPDCVSARVASAMASGP